MRKVKVSFNQHGGRDYRYLICCDICGEFLKNNAKKSPAYGQPAEFLSCGEEWLKAQAAGWICDHDTAICTKCLKSISD